MNTTLAYVKFEILEAVRILGGTRFTAIWHVVMPLLKQRNPTARQQAAAKLRHQGCVPRGGFLRTLHLPNLLAGFRI